MMGTKKTLFTFFLIFTCVSAWAKEVTDTLESPKKDRVIVTYDITQNNGQINVRFLDAKKKLGGTYREKYKKLDEVAVLFFDRTGNYEDNMEFSGINTDAFMIPKEVKYKVSKDGYFLLNDNPTLSMELKSDENAVLSIPLYIAHYEGKRRYKVFSRCEDLRIKLSKKSSGSNPVSLTSQFTTQTITSQEEIGGEFTEVDEANILIKKVSDLLAEQNEYPFTDELKQAIASLRDRSYHLSDSKVSAKISEVLTACKLREDHLKNAADVAAKAAAQDAEQKIKQAEKEAQARQDSIDAVARIKAEEDKKQNRLMIIGGVALAILAFVGNKVYEHIKNAKNQKNMLEMQANAVKRAEDEAKRRARSMAQNQNNHAQGEACKNARPSMNDINSKNGKKGKKGISI